MNKRYFYKLIALFITSIFLLSACSSDEAKSPEDVIQNFKATAKDIKAADFSIALTMKGSDEGDNIDFNLTADIKLDRREGEERKADADLKVDGSLNAGEKNLDGSVNVKIRTLGEEFYFNLMSLEANDPSVEKYKPLLEPLEKKWQHLSSDFIPENIKELQQKDAETLKKEKEIKELFVNTKLFDVTKEYGIESLNGKKVYHYGVSVNKSGLKQYIRKVAAINGQEMTDVEVEEQTVFADSITNMEMWIGTKDYYLYKGGLTMAGEDAAENVSSEIALTYMANSYDTELNIEAPAEFEEFNPISLLMGLQMPDEITDEDAVVDNGALEGDLSTEADETLEDYKMEE